MKSLILGLALCLSTSIFAADSYFHAVKAKNGDGIYSLLRRYDLNTHSCNRSQFLTLNNLNLKDKLITGKNYKLPIMIYDYNGTSIRTTVGIDSWEKAVRIKKYNEAILAKRLRSTKYHESKILWVPYHELHCLSDAPKKAVQPISSKEVISKPTAKGKHINIDLFGEDDKRVEIKDNSLKGKVYYIVSGHGGPDPGAMCSKACSNELCEDEYAYDVCLRLCRELISHGATAHMIIQDKNDGIRDEMYLNCDKDEVCLGAKIPLNQKKRLEQRASAINRLYSKYKKQGVKEQMALMVHVDSYTKDRRQDVYFFHHKTSKNSKKLAQSLQDTFKEKYNHFQKNRGYKGFVKGRGLYMLNNTLPTAAYVELANIRNPNDQKRLILDSNREALAKWLYEGMAAYSN